VVFGQTSFGQTVFGKMAQTHKLNQDQILCCFVQNLRDICALEKSNQNKTLEKEEAEFGMIIHLNFFFKFNNFSDKGSVPHLE
jgi:hypothetical protein